MLRTGQGTASDWEISPGQFLFLFSLTGPKHYWLQKVNKGLISVHLPPSIAQVLRERPRGELISALVQAVVLVLILGLLRISIALSVTGAGVKQASWICPNIPMSVEISKLAEVLEVLVHPCAWITCSQQGQLAPAELCVPGYCASTAPSTWTTSSRANLGISAM